MLLLIDRTLTKARVAVWEMRPTSDDVAPFDVVRECSEQRATNSRRDRYRVPCSARGRARRLSVVSRTECIRIVEEALTNVRKHAAAQRVDILWTFRWFHFRVVVRDDGHGFDPKHDGKRVGHWGVLGMQERASRIGARFAIESRPGGGTTVMVEAPYASGFRRRRRPTAKN